MGAKVIGVVAIIGFYAFCWWVLFAHLPLEDITATGGWNVLSVILMALFSIAGIVLSAYHTIKWATR